MRPNDNVFQKAKEIKFGLAKPLTEFQLLATEIRKKWKTTLVNGDVYYYAQLSKPFRLRLIFETAEDLNPLPKLWNQRQASIGQYFREIVKGIQSDRYLAYDLNNLQIDYFIFDDLAFQECVAMIDINTIRSNFEEYKIWSIQRFWKYLTVFYLEDKDIKLNNSSGLSQKIEDFIQQLAKENDPFGVMQNRRVKVRFDSKTNFERAGGGATYYR